MKKRNDIISKSYAMYVRKCFVMMKIKKVNINVL